VAITDWTPSAPDPPSKVSATTLCDVGRRETTRPVTTGALGRAVEDGELDVATGKVVLGFGTGTRVDVEVVLGSVVAGAGVVAG
jgi:hypothetical protein